MAPSLFLDTWGWLALLDRREARHTEVVDTYRQFRAENSLLVTSDYVLDETFTLVYKRLPPQVAQASMNMVMQAVEAGYLDFQRTMPERFAHARDLRIRFQDKPNISFTDLTSIVVMQEQGITTVLTEDAHFTHVGFAFQLVP